MKFTPDLVTPDWNLRAIYFSAPFPTVDGIRLYIFIAFRKRYLGLIYTKDDFEIRWVGDISWAQSKLTV